MNRHTFACRYSGLTFDEIPISAYDCCCNPTQGEIVPHINPPTKADRLQAQIDRLQAEIDRLAMLPDEPDNDPNVIWFEKKFGGENTYTYVAVKAGDGLWYTSGPKTPKGFLWAQLIEWIYRDENEEPPIWLAGEFETIN